MSEQNTAWLLAQWALWQREGVGHSLNYKSPMATFACGAVDLRIASEICDEDAMRVDAVMAKLKKENPEWYKILVLAFVYDLGPYQIAARLSISRYVVGKAYESAYLWCDETLSSTDVR